MTEAEWLACTDPMAMPNFLWGKASARKVRLFACACCRRVWNSLWSGRTGHEAILTAERFADGAATVEELAEQRRLIPGQLELYPGEPVYDASYWACGSEIHEDVGRCTGYAAYNSTILIDQDAADFDARCEKRRAEEEAAQASLLRDIFGYLPFRPITLDSAWLTTTVTKLAEAVYAERAFDRLPILADALEDAGCTNADILNHCKQPGEHVRGCWVVDLVLGKQ